MKGRIKNSKLEEEENAFLHLDRVAFIGDLITNPLICHIIKIESNSFYAIFMCRFRPI